MFIASTASCPTALTLSPREKITKGLPPPWAKRLKIAIQIRNSTNQSNRGRRVQKSKEKIPELVLSAVQVATIFGVSTRSIRGYAERGLLIRTDDGRYPVSGFGRYFDNLRRQAGENADTHALTSARANLAARRAEEVKLRLDRMRAEYVDRESAAAGWRQVREIVDRHILASTDRIAAAIPAITAHDRAKVDELARDLIDNIDKEAIALGIIGAEK